MYQGRTQLQNTFKSTQRAIVRGPAPQMDRQQ